MKYADAAELYKEFKSTDLLTEQQTEVNKAKKRNLNVDLIQYDNLISDIDERNDSKKKINNEVKNENEIINEVAVNDDDVIITTSSSLTHNAVFNFSDLSFI